MPLTFDLTPIEPAPPREVPEGGWKTPCTVADHEWALEIEEGRAYLTCLDPHPESFADELEFASPVCLDHYWELEDLASGGLIPVTLTHVDDSSPSTPNGPAEYGYYLTIGPKEQA